MPDQEKLHVSLSIGFAHGTTAEQVEEVDAELIRHNWERSDIIASTYTCIHEGSVTKDGVKKGIEMILSAIAWKYELKYCAYVLQVGNAPLFGGRVNGIGGS